MKKETLCVHAGQTEETVNTPIFNSTATDYIKKPYIYPRKQNVPNQQVVIQKVAALEKAEDGLIFSSGMAAITTAILAIVRHGDHVVLQSDLYGGTHVFVHNELPKYGVTFTLVEGTRPTAFREAVRPTTRLIYIETPSNPLLKITDIRAVADLGKEKQILTAIDNTFASPINQQPATLGIDMVLHSATKYIGGHSDLSAGVLVTSRTLRDKIFPTALMLGGSLNAADCYTLERSLKTLALRVERQNDNAMKLATWLEQEKKIQHVYYPGLESHPQHVLARSQMNGFGGVLSFEIEALETRRFFSKLKMIKPAISLGGVESTICSPAETSHQKLSPEERRRVGITDSLVRLSVGVEAVEDIMDDIQQALKSI